jgi:hypothetical protein
MWGPWRTGAYPIFYRWGVVLHIKMDMDQICVHRPTQTNKYRPIQIYKWFGPLKRSLAGADSCRTSQGGEGVVAPKLCSRVYHSYSLLHLGDKNLTL